MYHISVDLVNGTYTGIDEHENSPEQPDLL